MNDSSTELLVLAYILIVFIAVIFLGLFGLRAHSIWFERQTRAYLTKHQDYFDYVKSHLHEDIPLQKPVGTLSRTELKVIQTKLFQWMDKIVGAERDKLAQLCRDLGLVEMNLKRLRSEIHWIRLDAANNLGVLQAGTAVPLLQQLLDEERYGSPAFVIARAISQSAERLEQLDAMVRSLAKHRKQSHRLVSEVLALSRLDYTPLLLEYLQEPDDELQRIALTGLHNRSIPGALQLLTPFLASEDAELRLLSVQTLVRQGSGQTSDRLAEWMGHEDASVRAEVAEALGRIETEHAIALLKEGLSDPDWRVRMNCARSLVRLQDSGFEALCETAAGSEQTEEASLAYEVIQEELMHGSLYMDDFEQALQHNRRLQIYRQFFEGRPGWAPSMNGLLASKEDSA